VSEQDLDLTPEEEQLVARLRAMPSEGSDPDWVVLEREIRLAVGPNADPFSARSWWRKWRWMVPASALVAMAAVALFVMHHQHEIAETKPVALIAPPVAAVEHDDNNAPAAVYLDGEPVEVDDTFDPSTLLDDDGSEELTDNSHALLPSDNLQWIDSLDEHALDRAEHWLDHKKHKKG
jgi:hypothetical protein